MSEPQTTTSLDIRTISGNGFLLNTRQPDVEIFSITLDGLDCLIKGCIPDQDLQEQDLSVKALRQRVLAFLYDCLDFFLKEQSNTLLLYRSINYKIKLTEANTLSFCYLNKYLLEELTVIRDYLTDNLVKGFIVSSKVPFVLPVLFV